MLLASGPPWWPGLVLCILAGAAVAPLVAGQVGRWAPPASGRSPRLGRAGLTVATAALFAGCYLLLGPVAALPAYCFLAAAAVTLAVIDVRVHRLPDRVVMPTGAILLVLLTLASAAEGSWDALLRALLAGALLGLAYLVLALVNPAGMGLGDVKLAAVLGLALGWSGWPELVAGAFGAFLLGGTYAAVLLVLRRAQPGSALPFGPWMLAGAGLGMVAGPWFAAGAPW